MVLVARSPDDGGPALQSELSHHGPDAARRPVHENGVSALDTDGFECVVGRSSHGEYTRSNVPVQGFRLRKHEPRRNQNPLGIRTVLAGDNHLVADGDRTDRALDGSADRQHDARRLAAQRNRKLRPVGTEGTAVALVVEGVDADRLDLDQNLALGRFRQLSFDDLDDVRSTVGRCNCNSCHARYNGHHDANVPLRSAGAAVPIPYRAIRTSAAGPHGRM